MSHTVTRKCAKCGVEKPFDGAHFACLFGEWKTWCRECRGDRVRYDANGNWRCYACGEYKPASEFYRHHTGSPSNNCKPCENARRYRNKKRKQFRDLGVAV